MDWVGGEWRGAVRWPGVGRFGLVGLWVISDPDGGGADGRIMRYAARIPD